MNPILMYKNIKTLKKENCKITPFSSLMLTLAGKIGVGSLAGVSLAMMYGGIGTIFWMWIICLISAPLTYAETYFGIIYKHKEGGGPFYYIKKKILKFKINYIYALLILITYVMAFVSIQANTINVIVSDKFLISNNLICITLLTLTSYILFGGILKITKYLNVIVPIMGVIYISLGVFVIASNFITSLNILEFIIKDAFNFKSITASFLPTMIIGIQRGFFCVESGVGTGSIASSITTSTNAKGNALLQVFGMYVSGIIICTVTAFIILLSGTDISLVENANGIEMLDLSFVHHFSSVGSYLLIVIVFFFSFSTILTSYSYGETALNFLLEKKGYYIKYILIFIILFAIVFGIYFSPEVLWTIADMLLLLLILINVPTLYSMRDKLK